jgi:hypothetical protein
VEFRAEFLARDGERYPYPEQEGVIVSELHFQRRNH